MPIIVELPAALRRLAGNAARVEIEGGSTVTEAVAKLVDLHPRLRPQLLAGDGELFRFVGVFVNDRDARQAGRGAAPVVPGDVITLVPAIAGG